MSVPPPLSNFVTTQNSKHEEPPVSVHSDHDGLLHDIIHHAAVDTLAHLAEHVTHSQMCGVGLKIADAACHLEKDPIEQVIGIAVDSIPGSVASLASASHPVVLSAEVGYFFATKLAKPAADKLEEVAQTIGDARRTNTNNAIEAFGDSKILQTLFVTQVDEGLNSLLLDLELGVGIAAKFMRAVSQTKEVTDALKKGLAFGSRRVAREIRTKSMEAVATYFIVSELEKSMAAELTKSRNALGKAQEKELDLAMAKCSNSKFLSDFFMIHFIAPELASRAIKDQSADSSRETLPSFASFSHISSLDHANSSFRNTINDLAKYIDSERKQTDAINRLNTLIEAIGRDQASSKLAESEDSSKSSTTSAQRSSSSAEEAKPTEATSCSKGPLDQVLDEVSRNLISMDINRRSGINQGAFSCFENPLKLNQTEFEGRIQREYVQSCDPMGIRNHQFVQSDGRGGIRVMVPIPCVIQ